MKDLFPRPPDPPVWGSFTSRETAENYSVAFLKWQHAYLKRYTAFFGIGFGAGFLASTFYIIPFLVWRVLS